MWLKSQLYLQLEINEYILIVWIEKNRQLTSHPQVERYKCRKWLTCSALPTCSFSILECDDGYLNEIIKSNNKDSCSLRKQPSDHLGPANLCNTMRHLIYFSHLTSILYTSLLVSLHLRLQVLHLKVQAFFRSEIWLPTIDKIICSLPSDIASAVNMPKFISNCSLQSRSSLLAYFISLYCVKRAHSPWHILQCSPLILDLFYVS